MGREQAQVGELVSPSAGSLKTVRFGDFSLDLESGELAQKGKSATRLYEKSIQVLLCLLGHPGQVVSRQKLQTTLWDEDTFVDFENGLNVAVRKLRQAIGDSADTPRFIETLHGRGYRWIGPPEEPSALGRRRTVRRWLAPVAACLAVSIALGLAYRLNFVATESATLVVLPFRDDLQDAPHLTHGLFDELINLLANLDPAHLRVIARTTTQLLEAEGPDLARGGWPIKADYVLKGSARPAADQIRITVALVRLSDGEYIWVDNFDRPSDRILDLQEEIAQRIAEALQLTLPETTPHRWAGIEPAAEEAFRLGAYAWHGAVAQDLEQALTMFELTLSIEPRFVPAMAAKSEILSLLAVSAGGDERSSLLKQAVAVAEEALKVAPESPEASAALALAKSQLWDWEPAKAAIESALRLSPGRAANHHWASSIYTSLGDRHRALAHAYEAERLDPLSLTLNQDLAWFFYYGGDIEKTIAHSRKWLGRLPANLVFRRTLILALYQAGRSDESLIELEEELETSDVPAEWVEGFRRRRLSLSAEGALAWLAKSFEESSAHSLNPYAMAQLYSAGGESDRALDHLMAWVKSSRSPWLAYVGSEPLFRRLHDRPRFRLILSEVRGDRRRGALSGAAEKNSAVLQ